MSNETNRGGNILNRFLSSAQSYFARDIKAGDVGRQHGADHELEEIVFGGQRITADDNFDDQVKKHGIGLYRKMMYDAQVASAVNTKRYGVVSADWAVNPYDDSSKSQEIAAFAGHNLDRCRGSVPGMVFEVLRAIHDGYAIPELYFEVEQSGPWAGKWVLNDIRTKPVDYYEFDVDEYGRVNGLYYQSMTGGARSLPLWKFPIYTHQGEYGRIYGQSDLRRVYKNWWSKIRIIKAYNMALERFGTPLALGKYPKGKSGSRSSLLKMVKNLTISSAAAVPEDFDIQFIETAKSNIGLAFAKALEYHDSQILMGIMGQTLTSSEGNRVGSMALGNIHQETKEDWVTSLRKETQEWLEEKVLRIIVDLNFADFAGYPNFVWQPRKGKIMAASIEDISRLLQTGIVTYDDINIIRERLDLPYIEDFEDQQVFQPEQAGETAAPEDNGTPAEAARGHGILWPVSFARGRFDEPRKLQAQYMTAPEKRIGGVAYYAREKEKREDYESNLIEKLSPVIRAAQLEMHEYISKKVLKGKNAADHNALDKDNFRFRKKTFNEMAAVARDWIVDVTVRSYIDSFKEKKANPDGVPDAGSLSKLDISLDPAIPADQIKRVESWIEDGDWKKVKAWRLKRLKDLAGTHESMAKFWITDVVETDVLKSCKAAIISGITNRTGEAAIQEQIRKVFEKYGSNPELVNPARLQTIVRTNATRAIGEARKIAADDPETLKTLPALFYSAILDDRTSDICIELDGFVARKDDPIWNRIWPPNHYNCRSTVLEIMQEEYEDFGGDSKPPDMTIVSKEFGGDK